MINVKNSCVLFFLETDSFSGLFIYLFRGMNVQELNHLYVDFPQIYGFVNYNHHECKRADPPGDICCRHKSRTTLLLHIIACIV